MHILVFLILPHLSISIVISIHLIFLDHENERELIPREAPTLILGNAHSLEFVHFSFFPCASGVRIQKL